MWIASVLYCAIVSGEVVCFEANPPDTFNTKNDCVKSGPLIREALAAFLASRGATLAGMDMDCELAS